MSIHLRKLALRRVLEPLWRMTMEKIIAVLIAAHVIADFMLQTDILVRHKDRRCSRCCTG